MSAIAKVQDDEKDGKRQEYATPQAVFDAINREYGHDLEIDACALPETAKLPKFWTPKDNGLAQDWRGKRLWCNPPFNDIPTWLEKGRAACEADPATVVVYLLPVRTGTAWFREYSPDAQIDWFRGRLAMELDGRPMKGNGEDYMILIMGLMRGEHRFRDSKTGEIMGEADRSDVCKLCDKTGGIDRVWSALTNSSVHAKCADKLVEMLRGMTPEQRDEATKLLGG